MYEQLSAVVTRLEQRHATNLERSQGRKERPGSEQCYTVMTSFSHINIASHDYNT